MVTRILVAVTDSASGLAAGQAAIAMARVWCVPMRILGTSTGEDTMPVAGPAAAMTSRTALPDFTQRRDLAATAMAGHVAGLARKAGLTIEIVTAEGTSARRILEEARASDADLIVMGKTTPPGTGRPTVDIRVQRVLEFTHVPVLVVPEPARSRSPE
jgi:nucleotide-binding universal stress UspA family protein